LNSAVAPEFSAQDTLNQRKLADLRYPLEWFPATRALQRTVHLHVGPTNSGKTYHALQRLEAAESGIYAGPLRLLAHEVYTRLNAKGKKCALVTGEERRVPDDMKNVMNSCTVEMVPLNAKVDVAVIDEIQMMGDLERGWAWTQAFLGVQAKEVHLCGELRTIDIVTDLCKAMGDKLVIHKYERLSPLQTMDTSLKGDLKNIEKGDAVILFSRLAIHGMKASIEKATGRRCAVVYGSLPPETRAQQAALFNDPNNDYDYLVASDAIGMGLNLSIKRVVFEATSKHDGVGWRLISTPEIKQIGGRAGRYKTAREAVQEGPNDPTDGAKALQLDVIPEIQTNMGLVTTLESFDLPIVRKAMTTEVEPLKTAGLFPPSDILLRFASYFPPETPFSYIVLRLHEISTVNPRFHLCRLKEHVEVADLVQPYNLSIMDRIIFMTAPVALRDAGFPDIVREYAECVAHQSGGELLDLKSLRLELLDQKIHEFPGGSKEYLRKAETLHKALTLYLWLSYRFAGVFLSRALAFHVKSLVEEKIDECLADVHWDESKRKLLTKARQKALEKQTMEMEDRAEQQVPLSEAIALALDELPAGSADSPASEANIPDLVDGNEASAELEEPSTFVASVSNAVDWDEAQRGASIVQASPNA
jgi:ATP-dependent RNA helicase SUPV3L1/SUV3